MARKTDRFMTARKQAADEPIANERGRAILRTVLVVALCLAGVWVAAGLIPALVWALVIAIAIDPLYRRAEARWPKPVGRSLLAAGVTLAVALLVLVPISILIVQAANEAQALAHWAAEARAHGLPTPGWISELPFGSASAAGWWQSHLGTPEAASGQVQHFTNSAMIAKTRTIGGGVLHRVVIFAFTLLTLFFLLRDRRFIIAQCIAVSDRLIGASGERIGRQAILSVRGTIDGLVLVGIGEGAVMTIVYLALGVPHPILLGAITAVAAIIPFGAAALFLVAAVLLIGQGAVGAAIAVVVIGLVVVGIADHFIRPALIGGATKLPFLWVLIGILGGVEAFGLLGLFIGPATMAVLVMLWRDAAGEKPTPVVAE